MILQGDNLFRSTIFPLAFRSKRFSYEKMIHLSDGEDDSICTSVIWERFAPSSKYVHGYGHRLAQRANDKLVQGNKVLTDKNRRIYTGAYQFSASTIRNMISENNILGVKNADVIHHVEDNELAHADLRIWLHSNASNKESVKTEIIDCIWRECAGPLRPNLIGRPEAENADQPSLPVAPKGLYHDSRNNLVLLFYHLRFYILLAWWILKDRKA